MDMSISKKKLISQLKLFEKPRILIVSGQFRSKVWMFTFFFICITSRCNNWICEYIPFLKLMWYEKVDGG
jgi:hypothetical protein